ALACSALWCQECSRFCVALASGHVEFPRRVRIAFAISAAVPGWVTNHFGQLASGALVGAETQLEMDQCGVFPAQRAYQHRLSNLHDHRSGFSWLSHRAMRTRQDCGGTGMLS